MRSRFSGLKPNPRALGVEPLAAGERSKPVRIRAPTWVHDRLEGLSAGEIGRLLETVLEKPRHETRDEPSG